MEGHAWEAAVSRLRQRGVPAVNLAFQGGSPANTYAILRLFARRHIAPRAILFNVNMKEFNPVDPAFATLYPAISDVAADTLSPSERTALKVLPKPRTIDAAADRALSSFWMLYGMRADIRERLFGDADLASAIKARINILSGEAARTEAAHRPTAERFLGTYDLTPLAPGNVQFDFLIKAADLIAAQHWRAYAILTPTNHGLLHEYIDVPEYQANLRTLTRTLRQRGIRVLNYDARFRPSEFIDNDHLTAAGNARLAQMLKGALAR